MPPRVLTAELRADISKFETTVDKAVTIVKGLDRTVAQTNNELKKFGNDFGGANLIRRANLAAKAVEDIGGVARLTAAEQKKLATSVDQALEKYRALGQEVPPRLVAVSTELGKIRAANEAAEQSAKEFAAAQKRAAGEQAFAFEKAAGGAGAIGTALKSIGPSIAATFSVGAVVGFGKEIVALGGEISDLAARTGLGIEEVQEFQYAAESTGASLEDVAKSTEQLTKKLASGDQGALDAIIRLGLGFNDLRQKSPADAFTEVADAIGKVPDPMERTYLAQKLLGESGAKLLPAMSEGFSQLREDAYKFGQVLREDSVKALDEFGDKFGQLTKAAKIAGAETALGFIDAFQNKAQTFKNVINQIAANGFGAGGLSGAIGVAIARTSAEVRSKRTSDIQLPAEAPPVAGLQAYTKELAAAEAALAKLSASQKAEIAAGAKFGASNAEIAGRLNGLTQGLGLTETAVKVYVDRLKQADSASKTGFIANLQKAADEASRTAKDIEKLGGATKLDAEGRAAANKVLYDGVRAYQLLGQAASPAARQVLNLARATTDIKEPLRSNTNEIERMIGGLKKLNPPTLEPWLRLTTTLAGGPGGIAKGLAEGVERIVRELPKLEDPAKKFEKSVKAAKDDVKAGEEATQQWLGAISNVSSAFASLAQVSGGSLDGIIGQVAQLVGLMNAGAQAGAGLKGVFGQGAFGDRKLNLAGFRNEAGKFTTGSIVAGSAQAIGQGAAAVSALNEATNVKGRGNRAARGALTGASIGGQIAGPYGALAGAAVGALVGAFRNPAFEDVYNRVAKNFGVRLSDETAKAIAKVAKDSFKGDRAAAEIFSLDSIIAEGGGLKQSNIDQLTARLRDAFVMKEVGKFNADQLTEVLEKNYGQFADFVGRSNEIAGKGFAEIARLAKAAGVEVESINAFVGQQTARVGGGLGALAQPLLQDATAFTGAKKNLPDLIARRDDVAARRLAGLQSGELDDTASLDTEGGREFKAIDDELTALNKTIAENQAILDKTTGSVAGAQEEFDRLGIIAVGAFNAARASGLGFLEATDQLGPGLDQLVGIQEQLGLSGNAAFGELLKFRDLVGTNETLVASAEALNETILGLSNIGGLTTDTLAALEAQGLTTFDRLTAAGFSTGQAIEIQRGFIENLERAHEQLGVPIDENTQKLIDQARALEGLKPKDTLTVMETGFGKVVEAVDRLTVLLGGEVPAAAATAGSAIAGLAATAETELGGRATPAITGCFGPLGTDVPASIEVAQEAVIDLADTTERRIGGGCVLTVEELRRIMAEGIPGAASLAGSSVGDMSADIQRQLDLQAKVSAEEFARTLGLAVPDAAGEAQGGITDLAGATKVFIEGSTKELDTLAKKFRTTLPDAAGEAGRLIRERIPSRFPIDVDVVFRERREGDGPRPKDPTPNAATGAIVFPRPGGTRVNVAEAGQAEVIAPLNRLAEVLPSSARGAAPIIVNVTGTVEGQALLRFVARGMPGYARTYAGLQ